MKFFGSKNKNSEPSSDESAQKKKGFLKRLKERLSKTRSSIVGRLDRLVLGKKEITGELLDELEESGETQISFTDPVPKGMLRE